MGLKLQTFASPVRWQRSASLATYVDDVRVHKARNPLVLAHHSSILIVGAIAASPTARLAEINALLPSVTQHVVQPDFPWKGSRPSVRVQQPLQDQQNLNKALLTLFHSF